MTRASRPKRSSRRRALPPSNPVSRAEAEAHAQLRSICAMVKNLGSISQRTVDAARNRILEDPLSVEVRGDWYRPGGPPEAAVEYRILLCWGGPAARLIGELARHGVPETARLQCQDWFEPWTDVEPKSWAEREALLEYARCFF